MTIRTDRWIECDHGHCEARFGADRHRAVMASTGNRKMTIFSAAVASGWSCETDRDLCIYHAEKAKKREDMPPLFAVPDPDQGV